MGALAVAVETNRFLPVRPGLLLLLGVGGASFVVLSTRQKEGAGLATAEDSTGTMKHLTKTMLPKAGCIYTRLKL